MPATHPTDQSLAALVDGALLADESATRDHVQGCKRCQLRIGHSWGDRVLTRPAGMSAPLPAVLPPESSYETRDGEPGGGEVWRISWEGTTELAIVRRSDPSNLRVTVLPVGDASDADDWSLILKTAVAGVEFEGAASVAIETTLPWCVLDARIGQIGEDDCAALAALRTAFRANAEPPPGLNTGEPIWSRLDDRAERLDELGERFQDLANVDWVPAEASPGRGGAVDVPSFAELRSAGLPTNRALALTKGHPATPDELSAIETATGRRLDVHGVVVPFDLRLRMDRPRWRPALRRRASLQGRSEAEVRVDVVAEVTQPIAARGAQGEALDWDFLLQRVLGD